jgi:hypothetical protein
MIKAILERESPTKPEAVGPFGEYNRLLRGPAELADIIAGMALGKGI